MFSGSSGSGSYQGLSGRKSTSLSSNLSQYGGRSGGSKWSTMHDWMKIVRSPTRYRVGDNRFNLVIRPNLKFAFMAVSIIFCFCLFFYFLSSSKNDQNYPKSMNLNDHSNSNSALSSFLAKDALKLIYEAYNDGVSLLEYFFC